MVQSMPDDRTLRAVIRDEALRLFSERGPDAVSVRQIASAAGVSPGLIVHHFGSKDGLREAVDQYVLAVFDRMLSAVSSGQPDPLDAAGSGSVAEVVLANLPAGSPLPGYLRRLLIERNDASRELFARLFALSARTLDALAAAGFADPGRDPAVRAAFLLVNDLAVLLLREHLTDVLGADPLSGEGLSRWVGEVLPIYDAGLRAAPPRA
jgi:AcrR family transcriptional regulator